MATDWFTGSAMPAARGSDQEAASARLGAARVVRRVALREHCPPPPRHEVGPNRPPPALNRYMLTQDGQWLAYLLDYLGLWPDTDRTRIQRAPLVIAGRCPHARAEVGSEYASQSDGRHQRGGAGSRCRCGSGQR